MNIVSKRCSTELNREVGVIPTRSRRCNEEQTSKYHWIIWEGEARYESESEELPFSYIAD